MAVLVTNKMVANAIIEQGIFTRELTETLLRRARTLGVTLMAMAVTERNADEDELLKCVSKICEVPCYSSSENISADTEMSKNLDLSNVLRSRSFVVTTADGKYLVVPDPMNSQFIQKQRDLIEANLPICTLLKRPMVAIINRDIQPFIISARADMMSREKAEGGEGITDIETEETISDVSKILNDLIRSAIESRASDIHMIPVGKKAEIHFRIDGKVRKFTEVRLAALLSLRNHIVSQGKIPETQCGPRAPLAGKMRFAYSNREVDVRVNILKVKDELPDINLRILDNKSMTLHDLGFDARTRNTVNRLFAMTKGIVLVVGPTGSGKSTTLYAGIRGADYTTRNFFTVEDPVEQWMPGITQVDVNDEAGCSYATAAKAALRHDPDVMVIGEIRDLEVARTALEASNTGHLVFSTLHANNSVQAIPRLLELGIRPMDLSQSLAAILGQRLVRRICPTCKETYSLPMDHEWRKKFGLGNGEITLARGTGCQECAKTGYRNRVAVTELLMSSPDLRDGIERGLTIQQLTDIAGKNGYLPLVNDAIEKALAGITTFSEIEPRIDDIV